MTECSFLTPKGGSSKSTLKCIGVVGQEILCYCHLEWNDSVDSFAPGSEKSEYPSLVAGAQDTMLQPGAMENVQHI